MAMAINMPAPTDGRIVRKQRFRIAEERVIAIKDVQIQL